MPSCTSKHCIGTGAAHCIWQVGGMVRPAKQMSSGPLLSPGSPASDLQSSHSMLNPAGVVPSALLDSVLTATGVLQFLVI